jgi:ABC-type Fe2+-enterobactin transport system substrate-binding protein
MLIGKHVTYRIIVTTTVTTTALAVDSALTASLATERRFMAALFFFLY